MKTAIKLVLIDLLIAQIIAPILIMIPCTIYLFVTTGNLDKVTLTQMIMIPAQLAGQIMMGIYGKPVISVKRRQHGYLCQPLIWSVVPLQSSLAGLQSPH